MTSISLSKMSSEQRALLAERLFDTQHGKCFICGDDMDLHLQTGNLDIDHVEPLRTGGKDEESNFALTHASCNRSKQASDLRVARVIAKFSRLRQQVASENRGPNLGDVLKSATSLHSPLKVRVEKDAVTYSFADIGDNSIHLSKLYTDDLSGMKYFFALLPIEYLAHDDRINPRSIGSNIAGLIEEFHKRRPQLHVALGWMEIDDDDGKAAVEVFDGQHKLAAQILLGVKRVPLRIFLNPDRDILLIANTNAGTSLRQVAFDKSVQRHLGNQLFWDRVDRFRVDRNLLDDSMEFSEKDLVDHFKGEWREMKRYVVDTVRDSITHSPDNLLRDYIDYGGKGKERPLSYSTIEKTFYSFFIFSDALETRLNFRAEEGENPRELERAQIIRLMNMVARGIYVNKFDFTLGTAQVENRLRKGVDIPDDHLRAYRLSKEEILYSWLGLLKEIIRQYFVMQGRTVRQDRLFQYRFDDPLWKNIETFIRNLARMPIWVNHDLSLSVFGGKQNPSFWQTIFEVGSTPQGQKVLPAGVNLIQMIQ